MEILKIIAVMIVIVILANIWFNIVESLIEKIKGLFRGNDTGKWHELPPNWEDGDKEEKDK